MIFAEPPASAAGFVHAATIVTTIMIAGAAEDVSEREVQLLGQIVNHYQAPDDSLCDFAELLARTSADFRAGRPIARVEPPRKAATAGDAPV